MEYRIVALLALLALSLAHTVKAQEEGCVEEELLTKLDFFDSTVTQNDLHLGGAIVYSGK